MDKFDFWQITLTFLILILGAVPLGRYIAHVLNGEFSFLKGRLEKIIYRLSFVNPDQEMNWKEYSWALVVFHFLGFAVLMSLQMFQNYLPLNPQNLPAVPWHLAFNTAVSFITNTNWQAYAGENTLSYLTQMLGLTVQNFLSAGVGIAVLTVLIRGLSRSTTTNLGNFWADITRITLYIFIPLSLVWAVLLVGQGVIQNISPYIPATTLEGAKQLIPMGPAASQIAIKQLGTNGGGFFGVNSAHPFENPTPFSNWLELIAILLIPMALCFSFGHMVKDRRQGWAIWTAMFVLLVSALIISFWSEISTAEQLGVTSLMEGKETRLGVSNCVLWSVFTTAASNGSVNCMHSSLSPLSGGIAMLNILLGEVVFGGVGSGLYGMILFVFLTVFIAGLMVGRTPEYLGKKIERKEIQLSIFSLSILCLFILIGTAFTLNLPTVISSATQKGPHGLSEILYAFTSATGNNGSAFAGLDVNNVYYNVFLGIAMLVGRFVVIFPVLAIAGNLAQKKIIPPSSGTLRTDTPLFVTLLIFIILIEGGLAFFPALTLGPGLEHFVLSLGKFF
jgi:potassium-transporting ATPase potassium-binding subunit